MATIFRLPLIFRTWRRDPNGVATAAQDGVTQNRNPALLAGKDTFFRGPGQAPVYDWPNPTLAKSRIVSAIFSQAAVWQNGLVNLLAGKDTIRGAPGQVPTYDWPNPTLPKSRFAALVSQAQVWQNGLVNLLVGKDTFFRGPGQAPVYDWPNPLRIDPRRLIAVQAHIAPSLLVTLLAVTAAPFAPIDQPNPRGTVNRVALGFSVPNLLTTTLVGQDAIYGGPGQVADYDWFNPRGPVNRVALLQVTPNLFGSTLQALPVGQAIWPQPTSAVSRLAVSFSPPNLLGTLLAPLSLPPGQALWVNPPMRRLQATAHFAGMSQTLFSPGTPTTDHNKGFIMNLGRMMKV